MAIMSETPTPSVSPSPSPNVFAHTSTQTVTVVPTQDPSLLAQVSHVDPLVWAALGGALLIPFLHQAIKNIAVSLHDPKHRLRNYALSGLLNLLFGFALELQNSGVLSRLHNPAVAGLLASALSFFLGQQVYGYFVKTNEQLKVDDTLPVATNL